MERKQFTDAGFSQLLEELIETTRVRMGVSSDLIDDYRGHIAALADMLPKDEVTMKVFGMGFLSVAPYIKQAQFTYLFLGAFCYLEAMKRGVRILPEELPDFVESMGMPPAEAYKGMINFIPVLPINEAVQISEFEKGKGNSVGLVHGHFRILTPNHFVFLILAAQECDTLFIGFERGNRTEKYKGKQLFFTDEEREKIFNFGLFSLNIIPFWIDDSIEYSNQGYRNLVSIVSPNVYVGQKQNPDSYKDEMKKRAGLVENCKYVELPLIKSLSTTNLEALLLGGAASSG